MRLGLSEIEIAQGDTKIRVARQLGAAAAPAAAPRRPLPPPLRRLRPRSADAPGAVKSPMVGTAYLRASPETPPFVEIGSVVKAGDKLLLVEAMKTFNEIVAPARWHGHQHSRRGWSTRRIWPAALRDRMSAAVPVN